MPLIGLVGKSWRTLNHQLLVYTIDKLPALVVDCANVADPHKLYPLINLESMQKIYVFELEQLHKFRDVIRCLPVYVKRLEAKIIIVTTSDHLFNYHNEAENNDIYLHAWELMRKIGSLHHIMAGVLQGSQQYKYARKYCHQLLGEEYGTYSEFATNDDRYRA